MTEESLDARLICPYCGSPFGWVAGEGRTPRAGDVCGCLKCGEVSVFSEDARSLRRMTSDDLKRAGERAGRQVDAFRRQVTTRNRARSARAN